MAKSEVHPSERADLPAAVDRIMAETRSAYSRGVSYGDREWRRIARHLLDRGYSYAATVEILRSKFMRWGSDHEARTSKRDHTSRLMTLADFKRYLKPQVLAQIDDMLTTESGLTDAHLPKSSTKRDVRVSDSLTELALLDALAAAAEVAFEDGETRDTLADETGARALRHATFRKTGSANVWRVVLPSGEAWEITASAKLIARGGAK